MSNCLSVNYGTVFQLYITFIVRIISGLSAPPLLSPTAAPKRLLSIVWTTRLADTGGQTLNHACGFGVNLRPCRGDGGCGTYRKVASLGGHHDGLGRVLDPEEAFDFNQELFETHLLRSRDENDAGRRFVGLENLRK